MRILISVLLLVLAIVASAQEVLTNDSILKMVKSGLGEDLIVSVVQNHSGNYSLAPDDVVVSGHVVIDKGAPATGRIIAADKKSFASHNGKLEVAVDSVRAVDGHNVAIDGHLSVGGGGVGFGRTGKDAQIEKGQIVTAVVAAETVVKF